MPFVNRVCLTTTFFCEDNHPFFSYIKVLGFFQDGDSAADAGFCKAKFIGNID